MIEYKSLVDKIVGDGINYEYIIAHSLQSRILMAQIINSNTGIELDKSEYTLIRDSDNTVLVKFKSIPKKNESFYVMLLKIK